jgi:hypothetical protein
MFWATSIFQAVMIFVSFFSFHESYGPLILRRRAQRLRKETGNQQYHTEGERRDGEKSTISLVVRALSRPLRLLIFHPIIQTAAILEGFNYGILYIVLSTFSDLWRLQYHESVEISGLHYIAVSLGEMIASQIGGPLMDYFYKRQPAGRPIPEARLPLMFPAILTTWAGALMYGWTAQYQLYWLVVDVGVIIMLFGMQFGDMPCKYPLDSIVVRFSLKKRLLTPGVIVTAYVIDAYGEHTSSAMAASQFVRSLTAFLFPLFAPSMYHALGYGWGNSVLALAGCILAVPLTTFVWKYGANLRAKAISTY